MAQCKWCGKDGWLLRVDDKGLCPECQRTVPLDINARCRSFAMYYSWVKNSKGLVPRLESLASMEESVTALLPYADRGIPTLDGNPREILSEVAGMRRAIIDDEVQDRRAEARRRVQDATTDAAKLGGYKKAIDQLMRHMDVVPDVTALEAGILSLRAERDTLKAGLLVRKADVAIAKNQRKQARNYLVDALMALKHDATPDSQQTEEIKEIERRIATLDAS